MSTVLTPGEAYRLWAPTYEKAEALAALDERARADLDPEIARPLLDAACGTGRRLRAARREGRAGAVGVDAVFEMLRAGGGGMPVAAADLRALPFGSATFRTAWCRLAVGHLCDLAPLYRELARVLAPRGLLLVTDFHPAAARRGMVRSFRSGGATFAVEHHVHELPSHERAAGAAGLAVEETLELGVGEELRPAFEAAGKLDLYEGQKGLPVLLALRLRRA
ncbi:MAG TPA: class I SAM-dependent methyltransferase [Thermoanaerobaculia bacterium]|nr:class I SAM-dependent methyltransferase [Thermoanaerobaculia bacterium]